MKKVSKKDELMTCKEAATYLKITVRTLRRYIAQNIIPYLRLPSGIIRFRRLDLDEWLEKYHNGK